MSLLQIAAVRQEILHVLRCWCGAVERSVVRIRQLRDSLVFPLFDRNVWSELNPEKAMRNLSNIKSIFLFGVMILFLGCASEREYGDVTVKQLKERLDSGARTIILDVRTPEELSGELGRLEGVINIPVQELATRLSEISPYKSESVFIICRSGNRSRRAGEILAANGFTAFNVVGGMKAWRNDYGPANH